jgi:hypothetical protein
MQRPGLVAGSFLFSYYFYFNELSETKFQIWRIYFSACKGSGLFGFPILTFEFGRFQGLTCDFWAENSKKMKAVAKEGEGIAFGLIVQSFRSQWGP